MQMSLLVRRARRVWPAARNWDERENQVFFYSYVNEKKWKKERNIYFKSKGEGYVLLRVAFALGFIKKNTHIPTV